MPASKTASTAAVWDAGDTIWDGGLTMWFDQLSSGGGGTVITGPLSVTPLYTSTGDNVVWWDGANWRELTTVGVTEPVVPPTWDSASGGTIWDGGLTVWSG